MAQKKYNNSPAHSNHSNQLNKSNRSGSLNNTRGGYNYVKSVNNYGTATIGGRVRDVEIYRDRARENQKFPNTRRRIITGKELTTPLKRTATKRITATKKKIKYNTINLPKKNFMVGITFCVAIVASFLMLLNYTQIVLYDKNIEMKNLNDGIFEENKRADILQRELDVKNDLGFIINYAVNELGMVKEDLLQKYYISTDLADKAEVIEEKSSDLLLDFPRNVMSAIFGYK